jgi:hypothetical protein
MQGVGLANGTVFNPQAQQSQPEATAEDDRSHARRAHGCVR